MIFCWVFFGLGPGMAEEEKTLWSLIPPVRIAPPPASLPGWNGSEIDRYVFAAMTGKGLVPSPEADPATLLRRVHFDLTGLPPSPEAVEAFLADPSDGAFATTVDALLASPRYGERWGRHWLDVARYAESNGRDQNRAYPYAWRYRDYVIDAFNADLPYDRMIAEQLAGDLLPAKSEADRDRLMTATGFLAIGGKLLFESDPERFFLELADEQIDTTTVAFLGLTVACARCHNHKFDPITSRDYYSLAGIFRSSEPRMGFEYGFPGRPDSPAILTGGAGAKEAAAVYEARLDEVEFAQRATGQLRNEWQQLPSEQRESEAGRQLKARLDASQARYLALREKLPPLPPYVMAVVDREKPVDVPVLEGGEIDSPGEVALRGMPGIIAPGLEIPAGSSGRLELARWLADERNPLTARVFVNRIWLHLFGRGLVDTPDNFGTAGSPPSHPELLDHLALRFRENGWSVKSLLREIVLSRTYRGGGDPVAANLEIDADNVHLWRRSPRRLDSEAIRDALLACGGILSFDRPDQTVYERSANLNDGALFRPNRSVFLPVGRESVTNFQRTFDFAEPVSCVGQRNRTTVPSQALFFLNNFFVAQQADHLAKRLLTIEEGPDERIRRIFLVALGRPPGEAELEATRNFLDDLATSSPSLARGERPWSLVCQAVFAANDFRTLR